MSGRAVEVSDTGVAHALLSTSSCDNFATYALGRLLGPAASLPSMRGMGRRPREFEAGIYHFGSHGSDTRFLYVGEDDRGDFLERMSSTFWTREIALLAYAILGNHYHGLVRIPDARFSEALQRLHTEYSRGHNRRHGRRAHLFRAHCFARRVNDTDDLLGVYRYIARNPVDAGLVDDPLDWTWASTRAHAGLAETPIPLDERPLRDALSDSSEWRRRYADFVVVPDVATPAARRSGP
jgi:REP element-mobilizing transposase RayT